MTTMEDECKRYPNHSADAAELEAEKVTATIKRKAMERFPQLPVLLLHDTAEGSSGGTEQLVN